MGIFTKTSGEREAILKRGTNLSRPSIGVALDSVSKSRSCEETNSVSTAGSNGPRKTRYRLRRTFFKRTKVPRKPRFQKLGDQGPSPSNGYIPPPALSSDGQLSNQHVPQPVNAPKTPFSSHSPLVSMGGSNKKKKMGNASAARRLGQEFQRIESTDSTNENGYEPPNFNFETNRAKQEPQTPSEQSFDVRSNLDHSSHENWKAEVVSLASKQPKEQNEVREGTEFSQFVFDPNFRVIEKIAVEHSDPGTSDFSDFVVAAAKLNSSMSLDRNKKMAIRSARKQTVVGSMPLKPPTPTPLPPPSFDCQSHHSSENNSSSDSQGYPLFSARNLALSQQEYVPLKTITTLSSESVLSNISVANATVTTAMENSFPGGDMFHGGSPHSDPFKISGFLSDSQEWIPPPNHHENKIPAEKSTEVEADALIRSIMKASSRDREVQSHKPDPSPRGIPDSLDGKYQKDLASNHFQPEEVPKSSSDSILELPQSRKMSIGPQKKPPMGVPNNAILGSMLFRQTFSEEGESQYSSSRAKTIQEESGEDSDESDADSNMGHPMIPPNILTDKDAQDAVSGVTDDTCEVYKNGRSNKLSSWNKQAQNVLNQWRNTTKELKTRDPDSHRLEPSSLLMDCVADEGQRRTRQHLNEHLNMFSA